MAATETSTPACKCNSNISTNQLQVHKLKCENCNNNNDMGAAHSRLEQLSLCGEQEAERCTN